MTDATVLGMPLEAEDDDPIKTAQPLSAVVVAKLLGEDGEIYYVGAATEGLKSVETLGMLRYAQAKLERRMLQHEETRRRLTCARYRRHQSKKPPTG